MSTCWLWPGTTNRDGYGVVQRKGDRRQLLIHRVVWEACFGPIPKGLSVCHTCDTPGCVRPVHLFLGTTADNLRDMTTKGRRVRGSRHGMAKLTEADVREIRRLKAQGMRGRDLAQEFGVVATTISAVCNGQNWRHVS